ncbi:hypothetical protein SLEP1_g47538 [Rubroshorea leprosula]|uniref:Uncharacterized protein n=1 Tax=Rubroshorea leprosula TaxID=152421 RepID=A0AAV5LTL5_9ROSI|nr:hypothetical protein SLEP1_g47538 [Rubroshorea leprosula]
MMDKSGGITCKKEILGRRLEKKKKEKTQLKKSKHPKPAPQALLAAPHAPCSAPHALRPARRASNPGPLHARASPLHQPAPDVPPAPRSRAIITPAPAAALSSDPLPCTLHHTLHARALHSATPALDPALLLLPKSWILCLLRPPACCCQSCAPTCLDLHSSPLLCQSRSCTHYSPAPLLQPDPLYRCNPILQPDLVPTLIVCSPCLIFLQVWV